MVTIKKRIMLISNVFNVKLKINVKLKREIRHHTSRMHAIILFSGNKTLFALEIVLVPFFFELENVFV